MQSLHGSAMRMFGTNATVGMDKLLSSYTSAAEMVTKLCENVTIGTPTGMSLDIISHTSSSRLVRATSTSYAEDTRVTLTPSSSRRKATRLKNEVRSVMANSRPESTPRTATSVCWVASTTPSCMYTKTSSNGSTFGSGTVVVTDKTSRSWMTIPFGMSATPIVKVSCCTNTSPSVDVTLAVKV